MDSPRYKAEQAFDNFMTLLSPDRDEAGALYENLRIRLIRYFRLRGVYECEEAADRTLDRVIAKCSDGVVIEDYLKFAFGIARLVKIEIYRQQAVVTVDISDVKGLATEEPIFKDDGVLIARLRECLSALDGLSRRLVLEYYEIDNRKIDERETLAVRNGLSLNSLRLKIFRLKKRIAGCLNEKNLASK